MIRNFAALALAMGVVAAGPAMAQKAAAGYTNGSTVVVSGSKFLASVPIVIIECDGAVITATSAAQEQADCSTTNFAITESTSKGLVPNTNFTLNTGTVGAGTCGTGSADKTCYLGVSDETGATHAFIKLTFAVP